MAKHLLLSLLICMTGSVVAHSQLTITPKIGVQYTGISSFARGMHPDKDVRVYNPELVGGASVEIGIQKKKWRYSLASEINELGYGVSVKNSFIENPGFPTLPAQSVGGSKSHRSHSHLVLSFRMDKINNRLLNQKRLTYWYGAGLAVGFSHPTNWWTERQYELDEFTGMSNSESYLGYRVVTRFKGKGYFLKLHGGISFHDKKGNERIILDIYYGLGLKKMIEYDLDYQYGYFNLPQYRKDVKGLKFNNRGTYFGAVIGFPFYLVNAKSTPVKITPKYNFSSSRYSVAAKAGIEYYGIGKADFKIPADLQIGPPQQRFYAGLDLSYHKLKNKISIGAEIHNLGRSIRVINDSFVYSNGIMVDVLGCVGSIKNLKLSAAFERHFHYIGKKNKFSLFYGAGASIAFNRDSGFYRQNPGASYINSKSTWDNNYGFAEIYSKSKGAGYFLNIKTGIAVHDKKGSEKILLEIFYKHGVKTMQENTVNYRYYYMPAPGGGNSGSGIHFKNRGTTFGFAVVVPVYFNINSRDRL